MSSRKVAPANVSAGERVGMADYLRGLGYRLTPQRLMVLACLEGSHGHVSAEEIHTQVSQRYPDIPISTIYRVLELLEGLDMVTKTDLGEGRVRYHLAASGHHHHLICEKCGSVEELSEGLLSPLKAALLRQHHFKADMKHLAIFGLCQHCQTTATEGPPRKEP